LCVKSVTGTDIDRSIVIVGDRKGPDYKETLWGIHRPKLGIRVGCSNNDLLVRWSEHIPMTDPRNLIIAPRMKVPDLYYGPDKKECNWINETDKPTYPGYLLCGNYKIPCKDDVEYTPMKSDTCSSEEFPWGKKGNPGSFIRQATFACKSAGVQCA
jgi:hypothetical protein